MRILSINTVYAVSSTGKIVKQIAEKAEQRGFQCMIAHRYEVEGIQYPSNTVAVSSWLDCHVHNRLSRMTMLRGAFSKWKTFFFLKKVGKFKPDLIHLHNIHGNFINLSMLFRYIKRHKIKVVWTLHDCWPLTGNCKHFDMVGCDRWKNGCGNCIQKGNAIIDISSTMYKRKQRMFDGIDDMTIVTPSKWLADLVLQSPLGKYPVKVINNGIDLGIFKSVESDFKEKHGITDKKMILGVSFDWSNRKGLDVFVELARRLDESYQIVLVGTSDVIDANLPDNIISIHKTNNQKELAEIYAAADVFVNPTREETYPTVNMESLACGTPVITFRTGGSPEIINDTCGFVVEREDLDSLTERVIEVCENRTFSKADCLNKSKEYNMHDRFDEYIKLYEDLT